MQIYTRAAAITFSKDDKFILSSFGNEVKVCTSSAGEILHTLDGHSEPVVAIIPHTDFVAQAFTASVDGTVKLWDTIDGTELKSGRASGPIVCASGVSQHPMHILLGAVSNTSDPSSTTVQVLDMETGKRQTLFQCKNCIAVASSPDGNYALAIGGNSLYVWDYRKEKSTALQRLKHRRQLSCLAVHPESSTVATGDETGEIIMWYNCLGSSSVGVSSSHSNMHWHAHAVRGLCFTPDGSRLMSIGEECVLVVWQLDTGGRQLLPRIGAPLDRVVTSGDAALIALACADNTIRVVNSLSMTLEYALKGLSLGHYAPGSKGSLSKLVIDPRSRCLVSNSYTSSLQFYDINSDRHVEDIEIVGAAHISRHNFKHIAPSRVLHVSFSHNGQHMVTVDQRPDGEVSEPAHLKFWRRSDADSSYHLVTHAENIHRGRISGVAFHNSSEIVVTCGVDGLWKLWEHTKEKRMGEKKAKKHVWRCVSVSSFRRFSAADVSFSHDGSLLSVCYGPTLTLWDFRVCSLRAAMTQTPRATLRASVFVAQSASVVTITPCSLCVWDTRTRLVSWEWAVDALALASHPHRDLFAAAMQSDGVCHVLLFSTPAAHPLRVFSLGSVRIDSLVFLRDPPSHAGHGGNLAMHLLARTTSQKLLHLPAAPAAQPVENPARKSQQAKPKIPAFAKIFGDSATMQQTETDVKMVDAAVSGAAGVPGFLQVPSHTLPAPSLLYEQFMQEILSSTVGAATTLDKSAKEKNLDLNPVPVHVKDEPMDISEPLAPPACLPYSSSAYSWVSSAFPASPSPTPTPATPKSKTKKSTSKHSNK